MSENIHHLSGNLLVGSSHFYVDTTNNRVGITTADPDAGLHVNSNAYVDTNFRVGSGIEMNVTSGRIKAGSFEGDGSLLENVPGDSGSWVKGSSSNVHLATSTDKVGIGVTSPDGPLHLNLPANSNYTGFTYQSGDVKTVLGNTGDGGTNTSFVQVYSGVTSSVPDTNSSTYNLALQPYGGNVGIRVLQPVETLDILGSMRIGGDGMLTIESRTNPSFNYGNESVCLQTTIDGRALSDASPGTYGGENRNVLSLQPDGGYVGIGVTSPQTNLHVESSGSTGVDIYGGDTSHPYIFIGEHQSTYSQKWGGKLTYYGDSNVRWLNISVVDNNVETAAITVRRNGHIGINQESPASQLHVSGTGSHILIEGATNENAQIDFSSGPSYRTSRHQIESRHYALSGNGYRNWLAFNVNEGGESTPGTRMAIRGDGRVGIGKTDPASALDVNGVIKQIGANWALTNGGVSTSAGQGASPGYYAYFNRSLGNRNNITLTHEYQGGFWSRSRITINIAGKYAMYINGFKQTGTHAASYELQLHKNGSYVSVRAYTGPSDPSNSYQTTGSAYTLMDLNANDYVEVKVTGGTFHGNDSIYFSGHLIA